MEAYDLRDFPYAGKIWAVGAEFARQTMVGPLRLAASWAPIFGFSLYAGLGFDF